MKNQNKIFKIIIVSLVVFLVAELIYFGVKIHNNRKASTFYDIVNSIVLKDEKNYIGVGLSDYRYSDFNKYDKGYEKPTIVKVKNNKVVKEVGFLKGYNGRYNDVIEINDGYIAVGKIEMTKDDNKEGLSQGLIVKYDKNFKIIWKRSFTILEKTEFHKVKLDGDDIVVVGSSVYGDGYVGNHTTGGGILMKYDKNGKQLLKINNGGPYKGSFNDIIIEKDAYVVAGLGRSNSGIVIKYDKKGKKLATGIFGYTDTHGINAIAKKGNHYVVATTKVVDPKELENYSAAVVEFDEKLEVVDNVKYNNENINSFNDIIVYNDDIYVCGYTGKNKNDNLITDAVIVKYDKNLYEERTNVLKGNKNDYYSQLYLKDNRIYVLGYSNSRFKEYNVNGYDYSKIVKKYDSNLN